MFKLKVLYIRVRYYLILLQVKIIEAMDWLTSQFKSLSTEETWISLLTEMFPFCAIPIDKYNKDKISNLETNLGFFIANVNIYNSNFIIKRKYLKRNFFSDDDGAEIRLFTEERKVLQLLNDGILVEPYSKYEYPTPIVPYIQVVDIYIKARQRDDKTNRNLRIY